ncbi:MAG: hypothetical protein ACRD6X_15860 [Pyrinomonadaceae bacterium]
MTANDKARLLGLFFWLYTGLHILIVGGIAVIYLAIFGAVFSQLPQKPDEPPPELIMAIIAFVFFVTLIFTLLFSIPKIVAGYGLRKNKPWARTWAIVGSIMACMSFPIGTALGVFGLVFLFSDEGKLYFDERSAVGQIGPNQPAPNSWQ